MFYNKHNLNLKNFTNASKLELNGILIEPNATVATDSCIMIKVSEPAFNKNEIPMSANKQPINPPGQFPAFLIPTEIADKLIKNLPMSKTLPILNNAIMTKSQQYTADFYINDLQSSQTITAIKQECQFPKYKEIFARTNNNHTKIKVNVELLQKITNYFKNFVKNNELIISINSKDINNPIKFEGKGDNEQTATALLMPIKN